jgi:hypothetical protein
MNRCQNSWSILSALIVVVGVAILFYGLFLFTHPYVLIQWTTATEFDTAGFNLYRKEIPDGINQMVNPTLIPAAGASLQGSSYQYKDARIVPGKTYQYQLEDIDLNGQSTLHDPITVKADRSGLLESLTGLVLIGFGILLMRKKPHQTQGE